jgi:hypothetical protein
MFAVILLTLVLCFVGLIGFLWYTGPHYRRAANGCFVNLRQIEVAKREWALEHNASPTNTPSWEDLRPYFAHEHIPTCPNGGTYTIGQISQTTKCSYPGDVLP